MKTRRKNEHFTYLPYSMTQFAFMLVHLVRYFVVIWYFYWKCFLNKLTWWKKFLVVLFSLLFVCMCDFSSLYTHLTFPHSKHYWTFIYGYLHVWMWKDWQFMVDISCLLSVFFCMKIQKIFLAFSSLAHLQYLSIDGRKRRIKIRGC